MKKAERKTTPSTGLARIAAQAKSATARHAARATELLGVIVRRMQRIQEDFFDIGIALKELKDKKAVRRPWSSDVRHDGSEAMSSSAVRRRAS